MIETLKKKIISHLKLLYIVFFIYFFLFEVALIQQAPFSP